MGWTVNKLSGQAVGGSCRVVSWACRWSTVFEEFWYRSLGPTVLAVTGTVGWQVEGRGAGKRAARHGTEASHQNKTEDERIRLGGAACGSCSPAASARKIV